MERSDVVEIGIAVGSVALFVVALAVVGTLYGAGGGSFDGNVQGEVTLEGADTAELTGTVDGDLQGTVEETGGGVFNGTIDATFNGTADGSTVNGTLSGPVDGTLSGGDNGTLEGTISGTLNGSSVNTTVEGTISGTADGDIRETNSISADGATALVGGLLFFILIMASAGFWLSRQDD